MRSLKSDIGVDSGTARRWLLTHEVSAAWGCGVDAAWGHGIGAGSRGSVSCKHVGVDKRDGAELNSDEPDTDSADCGGGASEANLEPASRRQPQGFPLSAALRTAREWWRVLSGS